MRKTIGTCLVLSMGFAHGVWVYEVDTHARLSVEAVRASSLATTDSRVLVDLGLDVNYLGLDPANPRNKRISDGKQARTVTGWIEHGSIFEDKTSTIKRPVNHFYDPVHERPLTIGVPIGRRAPDWALEDQRDIDDQAYLLKDARESLHRALTLTAEQERNRHFGLTFQTLGHVIHHLQGMAQPEHVRNNVVCARNRPKVHSMWEAERLQSHRDGGHHAQGSQV